jgi:pimeloyl-ACP methyl ester carboxylesterase
LNQPASTICYQDNSFIASELSFEKDKYFVGSIDASFSHQNWGNFQATIYYPSSNSGVNTLPNRIDAPYPLIVFCHGFTVTKNEYSWIGSFFAKNGYIAVLFTTPSQFNPFTAFPQSEDGYSASIDYLVSQNQQSGALLEGMMDEKKIGIMGHSMGAATTFKAASEDTRIKAIVSLAPGYYSFLSLSQMYLESSKSISIPTQIISGSQDTLCPPSHGRIYYDSLNSEKEMLIINGANHDLGIWNTTSGLTFLGEIPSFESEEQELYRNIIKKYFISWFNYYLYDDLDSNLYIYGQEAWNDLELGTLSDLSTNRQYHVMVVDDQSNPVKNMEVTLYKQDFSVIWNGFTDSSGKVNFNVSLTKSNYQDVFYFETEKGNYSFTEEIDVPNLHPKSNIIIIPEFSFVGVLVTMLSSISLFLVILKKVKKKNAKSFPF